MSKRTLKGLRSLKRVKVKKIYMGQFHRDNHNEYMDYLKGIIKREYPNKTVNVFKSDNGGSYCLATIDGRELPNSWMLPNMKKISEGYVTFRSKDYFFEENGRKERSYGSELRASQLTDYGFKIDTHSGHEVQYHIKGN